MWQGPLKLPLELRMELQNSIAAFAILSDRDKDGLLTVDEFIEYVAAIIKVSKREHGVLHQEVLGSFMQDLPGVIGYAVAHPPNCRHWW